MHLREATAGFEPAIGVLQTPALPLGYVAVPIVVAYQATAEMSNRLPGRGLLHTGDKFLAASHIWSRRPLRTAARIGSRFSAPLRDQRMPGAGEAGFALPGTAFEHAAADGPFFLAHFDVVHRTNASKMC